MIRRDWADAIAAHAGEPCAACGLTADAAIQAGRRLELAHTIGRTYDLPGSTSPHYHRALYVDPLAVVVLCGPPTTTATCHARYDAHQLDIRPHLTPEQIAWAVNRLGQGAAMRHLAGRNWAT